MEDVIKEVEDALRRLKFARWSDLYSELGKKGVSVGTLKRALDSLIRTGRVVHEGRYYALSEFREQLYEKLANEGKLFIPLEIRKYHSDTLKQEVIKPFMEQLPSVSGVYGVYEAISAVPPFRYTGENLSIESHPLFEDLKNHVWHNLDPFPLLKQMKEGARRYWEKHDQLLEKIRKELSEGDLKPQFPTCVIPYYSLIEEYILQATLLRASEGEEYFRKHLSRASSIEEYIDDKGRKCFRYRLSAYYLAEIKRRRKVADVKKQLDEKFQELTWKLSFKLLDDAKNVVNIAKELSKVVSDLREILTKLMYIDPLPGVCEYLRIAAST